MVTSSRYQPNETRPLPSRRIVSAGASVGQSASSKSTAWACGAMS